MDVDEFLKGKIIVRVPGFWRRFFAFVIDLIVLYILVYETIFVAVLNKINLPSVESGMNSIFSSGIFMPEIFVWSVIFAGILSWAYFSLLEYSVGWTIGMWTMGLKIPNSPSFSRCLVRNSYILPFFPFTLFWVADPLFLVLRKRRLLEIISSTETIIDKRQS